MKDNTQKIIHHLGMSDIHIIQDKIKGEKLIGCELMPKAEAIPSHFP